MNDGRSVSLFCKYSGNHTQFSFGHRGGVEYETSVYKNILRKSSLSLVKYYGNFKADNKMACLVIEYLHRSKLLKDIPKAEYFAKAGAWIGELHRHYEQKNLRPLKIYDEEYYNIWLKGVEDLLPVLKKKHPWLPGLCRYFKKNMHILFDSAQTLIHGEYYTKNILVRNETVYPIDWESAAIGPGEVDLASLIDGWDAKRKKLAIKNYVEKRWPKGDFSVQEFEKKLLLVRIYFFLRWTGEDVDPEFWSTQTKWFNKFYPLAKQAGCN